MAGPTTSRCTSSLTVELYIFGIVTETVMPKIATDRKMANANVGCRRGAR